MRRVCAALGPVCGSLWGEGLWSAEAQRRGSPAEGDDQALSLELQLQPALHENIYNQAGDVHGASVPIGAAARRAHPQPFDRAEQLLVLRPCARLEARCSLPGARTQPQGASDGAARHAHAGRPVAREVGHELVELVEQLIGGAGHSSEVAEQIAGGIGIRERAHSVQRGNALAHLAFARGAHEPEHSVAEVQEQRLGVSQVAVLAAAATAPEGNAGSARSLTEVEGASHRCQSAPCQYKDKSPSALGRRLSGRAAARNYAKPLERVQQRHETRETIERGGRR